MTYHGQPHCFRPEFLIYAAQRQSQPGCARRTGADSGFRNIRRRRGSGPRPLQRARRRSATLATGRDAAIVSMQRLGQTAAPGNRLHAGRKPHFPAVITTQATLIRLTRLTDSGLSITEWKPVTGALPPLDAASWQAEFDKYRASPEYQLQNSGMTMEIRASSATCPPGSRSRSGRSRVARIQETRVRLDPIYADFSRGSGHARAPDLPHARCRPLSVLRATLPQPARGSAWRDLITKEARHHG